jgi:hypothetical protein
MLLQDLPTCSQLEPIQPSAQLHECSVPPFIDEHVPPFLQYKELLQSKTKIKRYLLRL